jgi:hypothetical protein
MQTTQKPVRDKRPDSAFFGRHDVHARELFFNFLTFTGRALIFALLKVPDG